MFRFLSSLFGRKQKPDPWVEQWHEVTDDFLEDQSE